jgi:hypothetical protein
VPLSATFGSIVVGDSGEKEAPDMPADLHPDSADYQARFRERAQEQERLHALDPYHIPRYLPASDHEFPTEAYLAAGPEEDF